jgi:hypothetical protein
LAYFALAALLIACGAAVEAKLPMEIPSGGFNIETASLAPSSGKKHDEWHGSDTIGFDLSLTLFWHFEERANRWGSYEVVFFPSEATDEFSRDELSLTIGLALDRPELDFINDLDAIAAERAGGANAKGIKKTEIGQTDINLDTPPAYKVVYEYKLPNGKLEETVGYVMPLGGGRCYYMHCRLPKSKKAKGMSPEQMAEGMLFSFKMKDSETSPSNPKPDGRLVESVALTREYKNNALGFQLALAPGWRSQESGMGERVGEINFYPDPSILGYSSDDISFGVGRCYDAPFFVKAESFDASFRLALESESGLTGIRKTGETMAALNGGLPEARRVVWQYFAAAEFPQVTQGETTVYIVPASNWGEFYILYYSRSIPDGIYNGKSELYASLAEKMLASFTALDKTGEPTTLKPTPPDFMRFAGKYTQSELAELFDGMSDEGRAEWDSYIYEDACCAYIFGVVRGEMPLGQEEAYWIPTFPDLLEGVVLMDKSAPMTAGGVSVGMEIGEAGVALGKAGFKQNMDIWEGRATLFYELRDAKSGELLFFIEIGTEQGEQGAGVVSKAAAWWGKRAVQEREARSQ